MSFPLMPVTTSVTGGTQTLANGQTFVVPPGVTSVSVSISGAKGGGGGGNTQPGGNGGRGALVTQAALAVTPGESLTISGGVGGTAGINATGNSTQSGSAGSTLSLLRGVTTLMSAGGGAAGNRAVRSDGDDYPGSNGANSGAGTGGTVTAGGGTVAGGVGGINGVRTPTAGGAGSVTFTWT